MTNNQFQVITGVYPTMITPYKNGAVDYAAVEKLVEWYWKQGCDGVFTACLSGEILWLTLEERVRLVHTVVQTAKRLAETDKSRKPMMIVASGHISDTFDGQVEELNAIANEKPDALILISNRMDIACESDEKWIEDATRLVERLPADMPLGLYESPLPFKRVLSEKIIRWCGETGRFYFIKDTCGNYNLIANRLKWCNGTKLKLFNANAQTLLDTLHIGAAGYCGVMANYHPALYSWMCKNYEQESEKASLLQSFLTLSTKMESEEMCYPISAKCYLNQAVGLSMDLRARSVACTDFNDYQKQCVDQFAKLTAYVERQLEF